MSCDTAMQRPTLAAIKRPWIAVVRRVRESGINWTVITMAGTRARIAAASAYLAAKGQLRCAWKTDGRAR